MYHICKRHIYVLTVNAHLKLMLQMHGLTAIMAWRFETVFNHKLFAEFIKTEVVHKSLSLCLDCNKKITRYSQVTFEVSIIKSNHTSVTSLAEPTSCQDWGC